MRSSGSTASSRASSARSGARSTAGSTAGSHATSSSSSGSTGNASGGCTPANPCDQGAYDESGGDAGSCRDTGEPNASQTGVACDAGAACEGSQCLAPDWPIVPSHGGLVLATPNLVVMTYSDDPNAAILAQYGAWIADGGYLPFVAGEYGVGEGTVQLVDLGSSDTAPAGTVSNPNAFPAYLQSLFDAQTIPAYAPDNLYVVLLPSTWADVSAFCQLWGGYHKSFYDSSGQLVPYAVIPNCLGTQAGFLQSLEVTISHEVVEGSTDPFGTGFQIHDPDNPWRYLSGEVGDLCESFASPYSALSGPQTFWAQRIWSNGAAAAGQPPCQPWPAGTPFVSLLASQTMASALPGGSAQVTVTGWASAPASGWSVYAKDNPGGWSDFATGPVLSDAGMAPGEQVTVTLSVPATALGGQHGSAWIRCYDPDTGQALGSVMVGVTAGCAASSDCGDPTLVCYPDGGYCGPNPCGVSSTANGTDDGLCNAAGAGDGTCEPTGSGQYACVQGGTATVACLVDATRATPGELCIAGDTCVAFDDDGADAGQLCEQACVPDAGPGGCPSGMTCDPFYEDPGDGFCAAGCATLSVSCNGYFCPADSTCSGGGCLCDDDTVALYCDGTPCGPTCVGTSWSCVPRAFGNCGALNFALPCATDAGTYYCPAHSSCVAGGCLCNAGFPAQSCAGVPCSDCSGSDWWCAAPDGG